MKPCYNMILQWSVQHFSTSLHETIQWECLSSSSETLSKKLEVALKDDNVDEAWEAFSSFRRLYGLPKLQLVNRMVLLLSYSSSHQWLQKAYDITLMVYKENPNYLDCSLLTKLALTLVRAQMPIPASTSLRIILENAKLPSLDILSTLFLHLVKTEVGSYLAIDLLIETCELFLYKVTERKKAKKVGAIKPSVNVFNLVLDSCVRYGCTLKAQEIIRLMSSVGIVADANSIILIARIFQMTGQRGELKRLKEYIDCISSPSLSRQYRQFYDCLLSLHFIYGDIDAATELVLDLYRRPKSNKFFNNEFQKHCLVQIGSSNLKSGFKVIIEPTKLDNDFLIDVQGSPELVLLSDGKLVPSEKAFAKLINAFVRERMIGELCHFMTTLHKEVDFKVNGLCFNVMGACIQMGWSDVAHDILDDLESAGVPLEANTYALLLQAYCEDNKLEESKKLSKQIEKAGLLGTDDDATSTSLETKSHLGEFLEKEIQKEHVGSQLIYDLNNSILFFCQANMVEDAMRTFRRMRKRNIRPTMQTFKFLLDCYSSLQSYRAITILWGEIKREMEDKDLAADRDLLDYLLLNFLKGGYFERVMEIISYMSKHNNFVDKWKYKREYMKFHKNLYRNLKVSEAKTEAQSKRLEHVRAFRVLVGINQRY
ncbi:pentatricopeptide repeat-containing protein At4g17616 isoform X2 [Ananas comosus]|uniref:Pentatricopeptide repeat-containing protein At4g17616 isoform X2 n=1 Tax=Ananas comosus TaxID=4615 RepID=A0A6P5EYY8_ANACO|nr:pentatricopeptide repeat-containing protein At4g17616 isoform X2 [Ananas comosus]